MTWPAYWLAETGLVALGLRRYRRDWDRAAGAMRWECDYGWHAAMAWRGQLAPERWEEHVGCGHRDRDRAAAEPCDHADPRWPAQCDGGCGYQFTPDDMWQEWEEAVYATADGTRYVLHTGWPPPPGIAQAGPGAMWDAWWLPAAWRGPDGIGLMVRCPRPGGTPGSNDWPVDAPATGGGRWTRTGDPRTGPVTVTPSIAIGDPAKAGYYHGYLTGGVLTDHLG
jgi:hypothetical protein